jgi:replication factor A2
MVQVQKTDRNGNQVVDYKPFVDKKKPSSMRAVKSYLHNGEHTLIPVMVKMIHSAVQGCKRFILKDGRPLHMVKLVGAIRNFCVNDKHIQINLEDGTGLLRIIFWRKQKECSAQRHLIDECNGNHYIRVIGEVADYYGVHEINAFDIRPVSSGNEVTHHFLEVAYSYEKRLESVEDEMMKSVLHV